MRRREFIKLSSAGILIPGLLKAKKNDKPDILLIMTDQWNPRCLGSENKDMKLPALDYLQKNGITFKNNYTPCPVCMPARICLITGLYPHNLGIWGNNDNYTLLPELVLLFPGLKKSGYSTAQMGKLHWRKGSGYKKLYGSKNKYYNAFQLDYCEEISTTPSGDVSFQKNLEKQGLLDKYMRDIADTYERGTYHPYQSVLPPDHHFDGWVARQGMEYIKKQPKERPYFLCISFYGPHPPMDAPGKYASMYDPDKIQLPPNADKGFSYHHDDFPPEELKKIRANYYGKMSMIDDFIGKIIKTLEERGTLDNTLIIFTADHGEMLGAHQHFSKGRMYEESARVPLIMMWKKKIKPGVTTAALSSIIDVSPTAIEAGGGKTDQTHFAKSLLPVMLGKKDKVRDYVYSEIASKKHLKYMIRDEKYKWFSDEKGEEHLYDLEKDPYEMKNLINSSKESNTLIRLKSAHHDYLRQTQLNLSAGNIPKLQKLGATKQKDEKKGLADKLYKEFKSKKKK